MYERVQPRHGLPRARCTELSMCLHFEHGKHLQMYRWSVIPTMALYFVYAAYPSGLH